MVDAGEQLKTICDYFGKANKTVYRWFEVHGIPWEKRPKRAAGVVPQWLGVAFVPARGKRVHTKLYRAWERMHYRCKSTSPSQAWYERYNLKERGIKVAPEWDDYATFRAWALANGFRKDLVLCRKDTAGDFTPENCIWGTTAERVYNGRGTEWLTYQGDALPAPVWARRYGLDPQQLRQRLNDSWTVEEALTTPLGEDRSAAPYPPELCEVISAHHTLRRTISKRTREA